MLWGSGSRYALTLKGETIIEKSPGFNMMISASGILILGVFPHPSSDGPSLEFVAGVGGMGVSNGFSLMPVSIGLSSGVTVAACSGMPVTSDMGIAVTSSNKVRVSCNTCVGLGVTAGGEI